MGVLNKNNHRTESYFRYMIYHTHPCHFIDETESRRDCGGKWAYHNLVPNLGYISKYLNFKCSHFPDVLLNRLANNSLDNHKGNLIKICDMVINDFYFWLVKDLDRIEYNKPRSHLLCSAAWHAVAGACPDSDLGDGVGARCRHCRRALHPGAWQRDCWLLPASRGSRGLGALSCRTRESHCMKFSP